MILVYVSQQNGQKLLLFTQSLLVKSKHERKQDKQVS